MKMIIQKYKQICKECGEVYYFDYEGSDALDKDYFDQVVTECAKCKARYDDYGRSGEVDASGIVAIVVAVGVVTLAVSAINKATDHLLES